MPQDDSINGKAVQWHDLSGNQRRIVSDNVRDAGQGIQKIAQSHVESLSRSAKSTPGKVATAQAVADTVQPRNVTLQTAANNRQGFYNRGIESRRAENPGDPHQVIPHGAGWYYDSHKSISDDASKHGFDHDRAIAASGVMSPMNSPENEKAAVNAMMDAKANRSVHMAPDVVDHLAKHGHDVSHLADQTVAVRDLPHGALSALSEKSARGKVSPHTDVDLDNLARGGTRQNMVKAEGILDGHVHPDDAVDPHSAPKVWSYVNNLRAAKPGSGDHVEYMGRVHQDAMVRTGQIDKHQQALDLYGHKDKDLPDSHLLSPKSHTVEDTWQNAATFNQPNVTVPGSKTSVFKAGGSFSNNYPVQGVKTRVDEDTGKKESAHADARVGNASLHHAYNNRATQKAAAQQGRGSGVDLPPVAMQEVGWVQMRKDAGKDPVETARVRSLPKAEDHEEGQKMLGNLSKGQFGNPKKPFVGD